MAQLRSDSRPQNIFTYLEVIRTWDSSVYYPHITQRHSKVPKKEIKVHQINRFLYSLLHITTFLVHQLIMDSDNIQTKKPDELLLLKESVVLGQHESRNTNPIQSTHDKVPTTGNMKDIICTEDETNDNGSEPMEEEGKEPMGTPCDETRQEKLTRFPMGRIRHIMKMDPDVKVVTPEATFLVNKSLELFVESLVWEAHRYTEISRKKTMAKSDVERAIDGVDALAFLEGALDE